MSNSSFARNPTRARQPVRLATTLLAGLGLSVILLAGAHPAMAATDAQFQPAFELFVQARKGDSNALEKGVDVFAALLKAEPANPVLMAYSGAMTSMLASTTSLPWKKMTYAEDGMAQLDKALALLGPAHDLPLQHGTPAALEVRFIAANTFLAVPAFMNRAARGNKLLADVIASPLLDKAPLQFQGDVLMRAAQVAMAEKRSDDARKFLAQVIARNAPQADAARAQLAVLS